MPPGVPAETCEGNKSASPLQNGPDPGLRLKTWGRSKILIPGWIESAWLDCNPYHSASLKQFFYRTMLNGNAGFGQNEICQCVEITVIGFRSSDYLAPIKLRRTQVVENLEVDIGRQFTTRNRTLVDTPSRRRLSSADDSELSPPMENSCHLRVQIGEDLPDDAVAKSAAHGSKIRQDVFSKRARVGYLRDAKPTVSSRSVTMANFDGQRRYNALCPRRRVCHASMLRFHTHGAPTPQTERV